MNYFEKVFKSLNKEKIKYLVVGGVAVNLHGYMRFTGDLDLLLLLEEENLKRMDILMKKLGYNERLPVSVMSLSDKKQVKQWLEEKNMKAYSFTPPKNNPLQIDIIMEESLIYKKIVANKVNKKIDDTVIPVISIDDLIKMKRKANRQQDLIDLEALVNLKKV